MKFEKLNKFIDAEQLYNNYSLYEGTEMQNLFKMNISAEYLPENQCWFKLPYFEIPIDDINTEKFFVFSEENKDFLDKNLFIKKNNIKYYPFFIHPETKNLFIPWIDNKYNYVPELESIYQATPTSSYRSLIVKNLNTDNFFIAKISLLTNVANGARHIDWSSAVGQFESCQIVKECIKDKVNVELFEDIAALGICSNKSVFLSEHFNIQFGRRKIDVFGNVIRKIPDSFFIEDEKIICSIASFSSLLKSPESMIYSSFKVSKLDSIGFIKKYIFGPLFSIINKLFISYGIILEPHCQNVMIELNSNFLPTGKFYYRDFDMTTFDRARFPFINKQNFINYIDNRLDRSSFHSNLLMRDNIGTGYFFHFLGNLIHPCLISLQKQGVISDQKKESCLIEFFIELKNFLAKQLPFMDKDFLDNGAEWKFFKNVFSKIHKSEIPSSLVLIKKEFNFNEYEKLLVYNGCEQKKEYFISDNGIILGFYDEILCEMWIKK